MSKIYTKTGDTGETGLYGGSRVKKSSRRVQAYGAVDQSNAALGVAANFMEAEILVKAIRAIQDKLFLVGGELASDEKGVSLLKIKINEKDVLFLEGLIDEITKSLSDKPYFVIPGKTKGSAFLHVARTQVRFAEREIINLMEEEHVSEYLLRYMNRLSDTLYAMSRYEDEVMGESRGKEKIVEKQPEKKAAPILVDSLSLSLAEKLITAAEEEANIIGIPMVFSVVDDGGNLKAMKSMDGAIKGSIDIAINKAYTAAIFKSDTEKLGEKSMPGGELYGIETTNGGKVVSFAGGMPIVSKGKLIGGLGVSGGSVDEDKRVCVEALKILRG